jgi:ubiquitin conjugation factor E4 B
MKDPVILPSSRITVDRPVIQRHLLSDNVHLSLVHSFY